MFEELKKAIEEQESQIVRCAECNSPIDLDGECINPDCENYFLNSGSIIEFSATAVREIKPVVKFELGKIVATPGAIDLQNELLACNPARTLLDYLRRHAKGDWGDLSEDDLAENEFSLKEGFRLFSSYETPAGKLWIITEHDRSVTTFLLPDEY